MRRALRRPGATQWKGRPQDVAVPYPAWHSARREGPRSARRRRNKRASNNPVGRRVSAGRLWSPAGATPMGSAPAGGRFRWDSCVLVLHVMKARAAHFGSACTCASDSDSENCKAASLRQGLMCHMAQPKQQGRGTLREVKAHEMLMMRRRREERGLREPLAQNSPGPALLNCSSTRIAQGVILVDQAEEKYLQYVKNLSQNPRAARNPTLRKPMALLMAQFVFISLEIRYCLVCGSKSGDESIESFVEIETITKPVSFDSSQRSIAVRS